MKSDDKEKHMLGNFVPVGNYVPSNDDIRSAHRTNLCLQALHHQEQYNQLLQLLNRDPNSGINLLAPPSGSPIGKVASKKRKEYDISSESIQDSKRGKSFGSNDDGDDSSMGSRTISHQKQPKISAELEASIWPDGEVSFQAVEQNLGENGKPYFGWSLCHLHAKAQGKVVKRYYYCLGVYQCQHAKCSFRARPQLPQTKKLGAQPKKPSATCPLHKNMELIWIPCVGGYAHPRCANPPCTIITVESKNKKN